MNLKIVRSVLLFSVLMVSGTVVWAQQWTEPTQEELHMTSQAGAEGATAIYLNREETTDDKDLTSTIYVRLKVLTEEGKRYGKVRVVQFQYPDERVFRVTAMEGRTIQRDGTVIPFVGKPLDTQTLLRSGANETIREFSLPEVMVGSILEYRYKILFDGRTFFPPRWRVQGTFFTRKAHYIWKPTDVKLVQRSAEGEQRITGIGSVPLLPRNAEFRENSIPGSLADGPNMMFELKISDVPPTEAYAPVATSYRVIFYYAVYRNPVEFWSKEGDRWSREQNEFIGPGPKVKAAVHQIVDPADSAEQKLRKIYSTVMAMENMSFTRGFVASQDAAHGIKPPRTTDDLWERKAGHSDQLTLLFVSLARAAGFKAYVMVVADRRREAFQESYLSLSQMPDSLAIVNVDGKDQFFDPDEPRCPYGRLAWSHTMSRGLRQTDAGTALADTQSEVARDSRAQRVANLTVNLNGAVIGEITMTWTGAYALDARQAALRGSNADFQKYLLGALRAGIPNCMKATVSGITNLDEYEKPLTVSYDVTGTIGSREATVLTLPNDIFVASAKTLFIEEKRESPIDFGHPSYFQDVIKINFPAGVAVKSSPESKKLELQQQPAFARTSEITPTSVTIRRDLVVAKVKYPVSEYPELRAFYNDVTQLDRQPLVLNASVAPSGQ